MASDNNDLPDGREMYPVCKFFIILILMKIKDQLTLWGNKRTIHTHTWLLFTLHCLLMAHLVTLPIFYHPNGESRQMIFLWNKLPIFLSFLQIVNSKSLMILCKHDAGTNQDSGLFIPSEWCQAFQHKWLFQMSEIEKLAKTFDNISTFLIIPCSFTVLHYILHPEKR